MQKIETSTEKKKNILIMNEVGVLMEAFQF